MIVAATLKQVNKIHALNNLRWEFFILIQLWHIITFQDPPESVALAMAGGLSGTVPPEGPGGQRDGEKRSEGLQLWPLVFPYALVLIGVVSLTFYWQALRDTVGLLGVFSATGDSKQSEHNDKGQNTKQQDINTRHYSPSLLRIIATIKAAVNTIKPITKVLKRNEALGRNCPMTRPVKISLPVSNKALANSLRWLLSNLTAIKKKYRPLLDQCQVNYLLLLVLVAAALAGLVKNGDGSIFSPATPARPKGALRRAQRKGPVPAGITPTPRQNRRGSEFRPSETSVGTDTEKKPRDKSGGVFTVGAPLFRQDVSQAEDLLEEISRIFGYARIPNTLPRVLPQPTQDKLRSLVSLVKDILVAQGLNEVITYSLISQDLARQQNFYCNGLLRDKQEASLIEILNPLSKEQGILRPTLIPSLVACIHYNLDQKQQDNAIFEIAKTFCWLQDAPRETLNLGIALSGERTYFFSEGVKKEAVGFLHLKGIIEILFARLGVTDYNFSSQKAAFSILLRQQKIGYLLKEGRAFVLELCLERLFPEIRLSPRFRPLAKYPGIRRDISFVVAETVPVTELLNLAKDQAGPLLESAQLVDYYKGKQIPPGCRGITISCFYRSGERTLTEGEINPLHHKACSALNAKFAAVIR
jgi:hypothetical protein